MSSESLSKEQIEKLGNTMIFLAERITPLTKTHILKLIYIIEEISIRKYGLPFFNLKFQVWKFGPVSVDLFADLSDKPVLFSNFLDRKSDDENAIFTAKKAFSDDEFSQKEISLLEEITERFKYCTTRELVVHTHRKDSSWSRTAVKYGIKDQLEAGTLPTTQIEVDMTEYISDDPDKMAIYYGQQEFYKLSQSLKR